MYLFSKLSLITWQIKIFVWLENLSKNIKKYFLNDVKDSTEESEEQLVDEQQHVIKEPETIHFADCLSEFKNLVHEICVKYLSCSEKLSETSMSSRKRDKCFEPLGPTYLLRSVRDQIQVFQEKRGILPEENNFVNLIAVIVQQSGQAMYAVFTMFLALLPVFSIIIHVLHFTIDRILELITTKKKNELWVKGAIIGMQLLALLVVLKFIMSSIFAPIFSMQISIITKLLFLDDSGTYHQVPNSLESFDYFKKHSVSPFSVEPSLAAIVSNPGHLKRFMIAMIVFPAFFISGHI